MYQVCVVEHNLDSLYDITVAYTADTKVPQTELDVIRGHIPREMHFHVKRYRSRDLPSDKEGRVIGRTLNASL